MVEELSDQRPVTPIGVDEGDCACPYPTQVAQGDASSLAREPIAQNEVGGVEVTVYLAAN